MSNFRLARLIPIAATAALSTAAFAQCTGFTVSSSTGATLVPGTTNIGNAGDDVVSPITLPFPVSLYGATYTSLQASSNGNIQFTTADNAYGNVCLPSSALGVAVMAHWDDLRTDGAGRGIFTSTTGTAPNRVFNIEWRAVYFSGGASLNFEVRLFEDNSKVECIYATVPSTGASATVGIQSGSIADQFGCNVSTLSNGLKITYTPINSGTVLCSSASANPGAVNNCNGSSTTLLVQVTPGTTPPSTGIAVTGNLTNIGGSASQQMYDDATHGDATAGDNIFSFTASVANTVTPGAKSISFSTSDQQGRTGTASTSLTVNCVTAPAPLLGPDVYTWAISDIARWGTNATGGTNPIGSVTSYSVGTTSSNNGDYPVLWIDSGSYAPDYDTTQHPVISQNMYRLKSYGTAPNTYSRFEHLGQSWLKHGFVSTNSGAGCQPSNVWRPSMLAYQNIGGDALGVNCTDTYGSGLNGSQGSLGAKNIVNATTGASPFIRGNGTDTDSTTNERIQVPTSDVASQPAGTRFFFDGYYVTADDSQFVRPNQTVATNALNNASWTEVTLASINSSPAMSGGTRQFNPGIAAWKVVDAAVTQVNADHDDTVNPGTGFRDAVGNPSFPGTTIRSRYIVSAKATAIGGGLYRYEYAVYNHNSDRSANRFSVPMPVDAVVSDVTFHAPKWHSGEPYSNAQWTNNRSSNALTFKTDDFATNQNANAIRWACLYNFGFTANVAPATGNGVITLFKPNPAPNAPASINAVGIPVTTMPPMCGASDIGQQGGVIGSDNSLDNNDFVVFINLFFANDSRADMGVQGGVAGSDGQLDNNDFVVFINQFFTGC